MADPNTQIDWWIAQAWQEGQGGADNDALVAWLHENGLTAISSYTILQAALSCPPDEAKEIVFGHPVWAGEDPDPDIADRDYTADTLEPEPEPDPAFELDDWAEQVEEDGPVYGEEGYRPEPVAEAENVAAGMESVDSGDFPEDAGSSEPPAAFDGADGLGAVNSLGAASADAEPSFVPESHPAPVPERLAEPMDVMTPVGEAVPTAPDPGFVLESHPPPAPEDPAGPMDVLTPVGEAVPAEAEPSVVPESHPAPVPEGLAEPMDATAPAVEAFLPEPATPAAAPATPRILKAPPATPAERAAVFAGAFGKKPAATQPETLSPVPAEAAPATKGPSPVQTPEPALAAPALSPLACEPMPQLEMPQPVAPAEPLFSAPRRDPQPLPPLFPPARERPPETDAPEIQGEAVSDKTAAPPPDIATEEPPAADNADSRGELEPAIAPNGLDATAVPEPAMPDEEAETPPDPAIDREQEPPPLDEEEDEEEAVYSALGEDAAGDSGMAYKEEDTAEGPRPRKRALLDPAAEAGETGLPGGDPSGIPLGETPKEMAAAAKTLGIDFRGVDPTDAGADAETAKVAKELGISFREDSSADDPLFDETALEAQKLGISFRDGDSTSGKTEKPLVVKYLPLFLGIVIIFFLLLLGATFAGPFIAWFKS